MVSIARLVQVVFTIYSKWWSKVEPRWFNLGCQQVCMIQMFIKHSAHSKKSTFYDLQGWVLLRTSQHGFSFHSLLVSCDIYFCQSFITFITFISYRTATSSNITSTIFAYHSLSNNLLKEYIFFLVWKGLKEINGICILCIIVDACLNIDVGTAFTKLYITINQRTILLFLIFFSFACQEFW